jgi:hypothetical protein
MEAESACRRIRWIEPRRRKPKSKSARVQILETVDGLLLFGIYLLLALIQIAGRDFSFINSTK